MRARAALLLGAVLACGCRTPTSMLVTVSADHLTIPADVASVRITARSPDEPDATPTYESADLRLCGDGVTVDCYALPVSVALRPGPERPDERVRVEVTAFDARGGVVTHDAALFTFSEGEARTIDFVLSPRCLRTDCAATDRACGVAGDCVGVTPGVGTTPDLATPAAVSQPVARWYDASGNFAADAQIVVQPPASAQPGDLLVLLISQCTAPPGWTLVAPVGYEVQLYVRRAEIGEASAASTYVFGGIAPNISHFYMLLAYRGVDRYVPGLITGNPPWSFPSFDVPIGGAVGLEIVTAYDVACGSTAAGGAPGPGVTSTSGGSYAEWGPLPAGPSGPLSVTCPGTNNAYGAAQLWLLPR